MAFFAFLNNSPLKREGFDLAEAFLLGGCPRFAVTSTTKSFLTQSLYGEGRNPPPSEPPELALSDPFSGLNDYDTGPRFAVTSTTKSFLTQSLYGEGRNPPPSEPPELALSDPFSGLNDYDTGVKRRGTESPAVGTS